MTLSDDAKAAACKQLEFYFSDSNLPRDPFMLGKVAESPDGFVPLALLCTFSRMRKHLGLGTGKISQDAVDEKHVTDLADALQHSETVTLNAERTAIKRQKPLDEAKSSEETDARSIYATPFPHDATLDAMMAVFEVAAPVVALRMRRHVVSKDFRGSVFVEFESKESAQKVIQQRLEFAGAVLQLQPKTQYLSRKRDAAAAKAAAAVEQSKSGGDVTVNATDAATGKQSASAAPATAANGAASEAVPTAERADGGATETADGGKTYDLAKGCLLSLKLNEPVAGINFHPIKQALGGRDAGIKFIKFSSGDTEGFARFRSPEDAAAALAKAPGGELAVESATVKLALMTGSEEDAILEAAVEQMKAKDERETAAGSSGGGGRGRGGGRRGRGDGYRGRGGRGGGRDGGRGGGAKRKHDGSDGEDDARKSQKI